jgi:polygalacturonase
MLLRTTLILSQLLAFAKSDSSQLKERSKTCTVKSSNGTADDSPAIASAFAQCSKNAVVEFSKGVDYNVFKPVSAKNLSNVVIRMHGNLHLPQDIKYIQDTVNHSNTATYESALYWFAFQGSKIDYVGTDDITTGWINSYGQAWWDANTGNGTGLLNRPHLMRFNVTDGTMNYFKSRKPIAWNVQVLGNNIKIKNSIIDSFSNGTGFPFNTDGFGITATNVHISDSIIYNGDDAIAVQSGSHNVLVERLTGGYASHGLSIGSLGQNQAVFANVSNIHFRDITMIDTVYAARFKSWVGGQGIAKDITWENIRVFNVSFPIFVTQTYFNQGSNQTQLQPGQITGRPNNSSVVMENFTWKNFRGTVNTYTPGDGSCVTDPCWYDAGLPNLKHTESIIIECNTDSSCKNFVLDDIEIYPQDMRQPSVICINATSKLNPQLGIDCSNGTFVPLY